MESSILRVSEYFDSIADKWDSLGGPPPEVLDPLLSLVPVRHGDAVLDVGTGTGILLPLLVSRVGPEGFVAALDISAEMLRIARQKHGFANVSFVRAPAEEVPYEDATFNHVIIFSCFPHLIDKEKALAQAARLLRPGGCLLIAHAMGRHQINSIHREAGSAVESHSLPPASEVRAMVETAGLLPCLSCDEEERYVVLALKP